MRLYYKIEGDGQPLILLHGAFGSTEMYAPIMPLLSKNHRVIAVDLQGHGRTADIERPISIDGMTDDMAALLRNLKIEKAGIMGYSMGGETALRMTVRHPELVRKLVVVSSTFKSDGWYPEILAAMQKVGPDFAEAMKRAPLYQTYVSVAPRPGDWPILVTKMGEMLREQYDWSKDVVTIKVPTLLVFGDADAARTTHAVQIFELLGGGKRDGGWDGSGMSKARLAILPGVTHYTIFSSPALATTATAFLEDAAAPQN